MSKLQQFVIGLGIWAFYSATLMVVTIWIEAIFNPSWITLAKPLGFWDAIILIIATIMFGGASYLLTTRCIIDES